MKPWIILGLIGVVLAVLALGCKTSRAGYESARYKALKTHEAFELRDYRPLIVAEVPMEGEGDGMNGGFGKLFRFISGGNSKQQKIAMTTPVLVSSSTDKPTMSFVMPAEYGLGELPKPTDTTVSLREIPAGEYAVYRFSGSRSESQQKEASAKLLAWVKEQAWTALSEPRFAYYDPPWTPSFLRRNEALVAVSREAVK